MSKVRILGLAIIALSAGAALILLWSSKPTSHVADVQRIIQSPQSYDGEIFDKLVALGPDAVPAIAESLSRGVQFPLVLVRTLAEFGDVRGADAILEVIRERAPYNDPDTAVGTALFIVELEAIPSESVCGPIGDLVTDETAHPGIRLSSASVVARVCGGQMAADAGNLIVTLYNDRRDYIRGPRAAFTMSQLYSALTGIDNEEAVNIVLGALATEYEPYILAPMLEFVQQQEGERFSSALFQFVNNQDNPLDLRFAAARSLLDRNAQPENDLRELIDALVLEARSGMWGPELLEQAEQIQRDSQNLPRP